MAIMAVTQWLLSATLLCSLAALGAQGSTSGGLKAETIVQYIRLSPNTPNEIASALARANFSEIDQESLNKGSNSSAQNETPPKARVSLPPLDCDYNQDCFKYDDPFLECREGQCTCQPPFCWVYYYEVLSAWSARNVFSCGKCGVLGSWCNATMTCDYPGQCRSDGFCHCNRGENKDGVCLATDTTWTYKMVGIGMGIVVLFGGILIIFNCYKEQPWRHPQSCWYSCCKKGTRKNIQRGSCEKSPAYTIQNHYASQNSILFSVSEGQSESLPSETSGAVPRRNVQGRSHSPSEDSSEDERNTSVSSVATTATLVSDNDASAVDSSLPPSVASFPPPMNTAAVSKTTENVVISSKQSTSQQTALEVRSNCNGIRSSLVSSNCNHERCTLCLPKGPSARPPTRGSSNSSSVSTTRQSPYFSHNHQQQGDEIEFTTL